MNDWRLMTNLEGLFVAGDSLFASNCFGHAASTGYYAGRHAAKYTIGRNLKEPERGQVEKEKQRVYRPLKNDSEHSIGWKELNMGIAKTMQNYCGGTKHDDLLRVGLKRLEEYEKEVAPESFAYNPHELVRLLEVFDILTVARIIVNASLTRKNSVKALCFDKVYNNEENQVTPEEENCFITIRQTDKGIISGKWLLDYFGDLKDNYEKYNEDYIREVCHEGLY